jgi:CheY-like chemotaxis protein
VNATKAPARVLIVEDEWLLAELLEATVRGLGLDVVGPASSVTSALELLNTETVTVAILDVSLGGEARSFPLAQTLLQRKIPFLFITGYLGTDLPPEFSRQILLSKPLRPETVGPKLRELLAQANHAHAA